MKEALLPSGVELVVATSGGEEGNVCYQQQHACAEISDHLLQRDDSFMSAYVHVFRLECTCS